MKTKAKKAPKLAPNDPARGWLDEMKTRERQEKLNRPGNYDWPELK